VEEDLDDDAPSLAAHGTRLDARIARLPVGPEEDAVARVEGDGARALHVAGDQRPPEAAVEFGHLDLVQVALHPVQVLAHPVHGQT